MTVLFYKQFLLIRFYKRFLLILTLLRYKQACLLFWEEKKQAYEYACGDDSNNRGNRDLSRVILCFNISRATSDTVYSPVIIYYRINKMLIYIFIDI